MLMNPRGVFQFPRDRLIGDVNRKILLLSFCSILS